MKRAKRCFKNRVWFEVAANEAGCARADTVFFDGCSRCLFQDQVVGETEIIVAGEIKKLTPVDDDPRSLRRRDVSQRAVQPVGAQLIEVAAELVTEV